MSTIKTYQGLIDRLVTTVQRDDLANQYLDIANRAVREVAIKYSFKEMKSKFVTTIAIGTTNVPLPADFKELQDGRYPILDSIDNGVTYQPAPAFSRTEIEKLRGAGLVASNGFLYTQKIVGGGFENDLDLLFPATVLHTTNIFYYAYPADCVDPSNAATCPLLVSYFNLVLLKAYSIAFEDINDPLYELHETQFLKDLQQATDSNFNDLRIGNTPSRE